MTIRQLADHLTVETFPVPPAGVDLRQVDDRILNMFGIYSGPGVINDEPRYRSVLDGKVTLVEPRFKSFDRRSILVPEPPEDVRSGKTRAATSMTSPNWSGGVVYAPSSNDFFQYASARWTVPTVSLPSSSEPWGTHYHTDVWVGIDGSGSTDVFQVGT